MRVVGQVLDRRNEIIQVDTHTFQLVIEGVITVEGTYDQVRACAIESDFTDVDTAMHSIIMENHSHAFFGINRSFMYTANKAGYKHAKLRLVQ